jgi:glycosyltransferase involved in cell wall biosynthesis
VYVKGLAEELSKLGVENVVAAPVAGSPDPGFGIQGFVKPQMSNGIKVWRFGCRGSGGDLGEIYGQGDPVAAEGFKKVLDAERPDIVHFHAWSPAVSILLVREVKRRGLQLVQTYHTPTLSCPRGTLMRWGKIVCDGDLARRPCVACCIQGKAEKVWRKKIIHGMPDTGCRIQGESQHRNSPNPEARIPNPNIQGIRMLVSKLTTMFRMPGLIRKRTEAVREMFREVDAMVALNEWSRKLLILNGVEESKIRLIRHGIPDSEFGIRYSGYGIRGRQDDGGWRKEAGTALKLVFLGRVAPEKGLDVLLKALGLVKTRVELDIYGIGSEGGFMMDMKYGISDIGNAQVRWLEPVKPEEVVETIRKYDALVVPSVWLETGPLVVLEAFAAGVPVIGSRLGGIAEMVRDGEDGLLFEAGCPSKLASAIQIFERVQPILRSNVGEPKTSGEVASQHLKLYKELLP